MTRIFLNGGAGPGANQSWSGGNIWSQVATPVARLANNGLRPAIISALYLYASGRFGGASVRFWVSDGDGAAPVYSGLFGIGQQYPVSTLIGAGVGKFFHHSDGSRMRVGVDGGGTLLTIGRHAAAGWDIYSGGGVQWAGHYMAGEIDFLESPTAPQAAAGVQVAPGTARVSWSAPADDGGTPVTGYIVQRTTALPWGSAPIQAVTVIPGARSFDWNGLTPGTHFFQVFAGNAVTAVDGTASLPSGTVQVQLTSGVTGDIDSWERFGTIPAGVIENTPAGLRRVTLNNLIPSEQFPARSAIVKESYVTAGTVTLNATEHGATREVAGLTPGRVYRLSANGAWLGTVGGVDAPNTYQIGVEGIGWAPAVEFTNSRLVFGMGTYEFIATATTHEIGFRLAETMTRTGPVELEQFAIFDIQLLEMPVSISPYRLQNVAYESSLVNHFDLACNSVGGRWWVDRGGVTQFAADLGDGAVAGTFADVRGDGRLEYLDIGMSYDTRAIVNDLDVENHGAVLGDNGWTTDDETRNYKNLTSIATWGPRNESIDLSLYDEGAFAGSVDDRAGDLLDDDETIGKQPVWIRWNAQESPAVAASLEIYSRVDIIFQGITYQCRVVNLSHELTPTRWIIRMELIRK